ncbi:MAG: hypothetical protein NC914_03895 [Candidatus Omnitrophica bacterium]|nr:hypothetical protein [Candidatus Omnitrophota bacterium]
MKDKGLCNTCAYAKGCVFPTKFPVLECEEFSDYIANGKLRKPGKIHRVVSSYVATESE